ncbi:hypothetical protein PVK06_037324 [Gossypium arboreum]|uniref:RNase H type-1 domain-containing protein n=1 Tax=Gossypium arboreum TaxID=29729 RepID=A0ABR0MZI7_GOSAR|nr:hypothetical protein PVK06_037324 [Gossypium arboreum]
MVGASWMVPEQGWIKLNNDGVILVPNGSTSIGGVFRDHCARWISGFTMQTREESVFLEAPLKLREW